jgi:GxxExxY protein
MAQIDRVANAVVDASFTVHRRLGPGLLESVYERCLAYEVGKRGFEVARQVEQPVVYDNVRFDSALRLDLVVNGLVIVELKAVEALAPIHTAQMLTYLKLSGLHLGLLINFNVPVIKDGIKRVAL